MDLCHNVENYISFYHDCRNATTIILNIKKESRGRTVGYRQYISCVVALPPIEALSVLSVYHGCQGLLSVVKCCHNPEVNRGVEFGCGLGVARFPTERHPGKTWGRDSIAREIERHGAGASHPLSTKGHALQGVMLDVF
jgi:hypothetical protein